MYSVIETHTGQDYCRVTADNVYEYRGGIPSEDELSQMADLFRLLANPTRVKILTALRVRPLCVSCLSMVLDMEQSAVSQQLKILRHSKLVAGRRQGRMIIYELADPRVDALVRMGLEYGGEARP